MLKREDNELLTRVGPGTPMGELFRRFWLPALLPEELPHPDCPPVRLRLLGENLIAFRDTEGRLGVLDELCPHRRASLFYGRNEEEWTSMCLSRLEVRCRRQLHRDAKRTTGQGFQAQGSIKTYAAAEWGGYIWVYMGPPKQKPPLPEFEWATLPPSHRWQRKWMYHANYMQGLEGELDTRHTSFLHRTTDLSVLSPGLPNPQRTGASTACQAFTFVTRTTATTTAQNET